ncbi:MAG: stalk domain-containing protein [Defluviitaleaceae bacterium]|nr:stalk domain-containing protein [Defluviitaleaceae bacterium]
MFKKCTALLLAAVLAAAFVLVASADQTDQPMSLIATAPGGFPVTVRVEDCVAGQEATLMAPTTVSLTAGADTAIDALQAALTQTGADADALQYTVGDYGAFITSLLGAAGDDNNSWMYAVNDAIPAVSADNYALAGGDSVVFYFIAWQAGGLYTYFDKQNVAAIANEAFSLTLNSADWEGTVTAIEGAAILINGKPSDFTTDADGAAGITIADPGIYVVSASLLDADGNETISRPLCNVSVTAETASAPAGENIQTLFVNMSDGTVEVDGAAIDTPVAPFMQGSECFVPLRAVADALGGEVGWDAASSTATVAYDGQTYGFNVAEAGAASGICPVIIGDRMMVPVGEINAIFGITAEIGE